MTLKPSFYNHYTSLDGDRQTVLFNKFWGSVAVVDRRCADAVAEADLAAIPLSQINSLEAGGFLVAVDLDERAAARERYQLRKANNSLLGITIELTQECNLACTFCYQNSYRGTGEITDLAIERVEQYIATVVTEARRPIEEIALRFIGGEPLMQKKKILVAIIPRPTFSPCSAYTPYNLKITADGRLALCDAMTKPRGSADELLDDVGKIREIFADVDAHDPFQDPQCGNCTNVGICGGKLYRKPDLCDFLPFDMDEFLRFFVGAYPAAPNKFDLGLSVSSPFRLRSPVVLMRSCLVEQYRCRHGDVE